MTTLTSPSSVTLSSVHSQPTFSPTSIAYLNLLNRVLVEGESEVAPRGKATLELVDTYFVVDNPDSKPIVTHDLERNKVIADYTKKEFDLYYSEKANMAYEFGEASKFWLSLANPDGSLNSCYGALIFGQATCGNPQFNMARYVGHWPLSDEERLAAESDPNTALVTPWQWAVNSLLMDKSSRQAYVRFSRPDHQWIGNRDQVCTMHGQFQIRHDRLNLTIIMRSNDLIRGLVYDMPFFVSLLEKMQSELVRKYPSLRIGQYRHFSHSSHVYEADIAKAKAMLGVDEF